MNLFDKYDNLFDCSVVYLDSYTSEHSEHERRFSRMMISSFAPGKVTSLTQTQCSDSCLLVLLVTMTHKKNK